MPPNKDAADVNAVKTPKAKASFQTEDSAALLGAGGAGKAPQQQAGLVAPVRQLLHRLLARFNSSDDVLDGRPRSDRCVDSVKCCKAHAGLPLTPHVLP